MITKSNPLNEKKAPKDLRPIAYISVIVLAALAIGSILWSFAFYLFSLNEKVDQNTQNIQSIIQYINQRTAATPGTTSPSPK